MTPDEIDARRDALIRRLMKTPIDALAKDVPRTTSEADLVRSVEPVDASSYEQGLQEARIKNETLGNDILQENVNELRLKQDHRRSFYRWAIAAISIVLLVNVGIFCWHMVATSGQPSDAVMVAWFSSTIVETLGLGYVIGNYLFDGRRTVSGRSASNSG